jgi:fucose 4-O-acetylase-like acetyltransferase
LEVQNIFSNFAAIMENIIAKKPRLEWLDALRGFTMILVVANHVAVMGFDEEWKHSSAIPFLVLFRMPLFFFVSGFLAYKASQIWNLRNLGSLVSKKLRVQIIPTLAFFLLVTAIFNKDIWSAVVTSFHSAGKGGYWFTIALLYMFIIYYLFAYLESKLKWKSWIPITLLFIVSLCFYETNYLPRYFSWAAGYRGAKTDLYYFLQDTTLVQVLLYFPFFLYGNIVHRYWDKAQRVMDSKWFFPIVIIVVILATLDALKWHNLRMEWGVVPLTISRFGLLTITFMYFRNYKQYFTQLSPIGASLQYIGRRTLDIYLIHYLFIPDIPTIGAFIKSYPHNFVVDVVLSVILGLAIIGFSIITSNILRISPFFKKWLFGRS